MLGVLPERFEAMNANGYRFALPDGAVELARGPVTQAFRVGTHARGVQFHPEVRHQQAMAWFSAESRELPRPLAEIERELTEKLPCVAGARPCAVRCVPAQRSRRVSDVAARPVVPAWVL